MKQRTFPPTSKCSFVKMKVSASLAVALALSAESVYAGPPASTRSRLLNSGFISGGTIKLKPNASQASAPIPTAITVDTTLNPMSSGSIGGTSIAGQGGTLYTIGTNYGITAGNNEFFSFSTFNVGAGDTAQFIAASNTTNIISRVTGGSSSTINGTIESPVSLWFVNPAGVIVGSGAQINVTGGFSRSAADYVGFANGDRWYAIDGNATVTNPSVLSSSLPASFGFLSNIEFDGTLGAHTTNTPVAPINGTYTITPSEGTVSGPSANSTYNLFFSFANFNLNAGETALFTNDPNPTYASGSFSNIISRVTGGQASTINGTVDSSAFLGANFWFVNPAGVMVGSGGKLNVTGGLAIGAADYISFVGDSSRFYSLPSDNSAFSMLSAAPAMDFGFLPGSTPGPVSIASSASQLGRGQSALPFFFAYFEGGNVTLDSVSITSAPFGNYGSSGIEVIATTGAVTVNGSTLKTGSPLYVDGGDSGSITISGLTAVDVTGPTTIISQGTLGNAGPVAITSPGYVSIDGLGLYSSARSLGPATSGAVTINGGAGVTINQSSVSTQQIVNGTAGSILVSSGGLVSLSASTLNTSTSNPIVNGPVGLNSGNISISGSGVLIDQQSVVSTNYSNATSSSPGGPGSVTIFTTGSAAPGDLLSSNLTAPTAGVLRIVDSSITATNAGGVGPNDSVAGLGQIWLGKDSLGSSGAVSDNVVIAGSVLSTDVSAGGIGSNLTIEAKNGVWIGASTTPTGGYPILAPGNPQGVNDTRTSSIQSLITSESNNGGGNAGDISIISTAGTLHIGGATILSSSANGVAATGTTAAVESGNAGTITLTANLGTVQVGVSTDSLASPNIVSTSANADAGQAGNIVLNGEGISLFDTRVLTTVATQTTPDATNMYAPASVMLSGSAAVALTDTLIDTRTSGMVGAGSVSITGASVSIAGGQSPAPGAPYAYYGLPLNTSIFSATAGGTGSAGSITISGTAGSVTVSDSSIIAQSGTPGGAGGGAAGMINLSGSNINLESSTLSTAMYSSATTTPSLIALSTTKDGAVSITNSLIDTTTSGAASAGLVTIMGGSIAISGGQEPAASGIADTNLPSNTAIFSGTGGHGNAGTVTISATGGVTVTNATISAQSGGGAGNGGAGVINVGGASIDLEGATVSTVTESSLPTATPASIAINAVDGGSVILNNSLLDARTSGAVSAGAITVTGGSVSITGGPADGQDRGGEAGLVPLSANTAIFSDTSYTGDAGSITVAATASSTTPAATGLVTVSGAVLSSQSGGNTGNGGTISISGSGVLIAGQSMISSNYANGGGNPGAPGSIAIFANGASAPNDPLSTNLTVATPGVVRVVDSAVTATNTGGTGVSGSVAGRGEIWIGTDFPTASGHISDDVIVAGSVLSTDVSAQGIGNNLTIEANDGIWIGPSSTGGYPLLPVGNILGVSDIRTSPTQSILSSQTETSAVSGGQILLQAGVGGQGGSRGITIISSDLDADNQVNSQAAGTTRFTSNITVDATLGSVAGLVSLSDAKVTTETSGVNSGGDIVVKGGSVQISGGTLSASTTAASTDTNVLYDVGDAGSISITATQMDPAPGSAALSVSNAIISSDAGTAAAIVDASGRPNIAYSETFVDGQPMLIPVIDPRTNLPKLAIPEAGTVNLTATAGSVAFNGGALSSQAGAQAGDAGTVSISATNGSVELVGNPGLTGNIFADVNSPYTYDSNGNRISRTIGFVNVIGQHIDISGATINTSSSGAVSGGSVTLTATGADAADGTAALYIHNGATIGTGTPDTGSVLATAGSIQLNAPAGTVQVTSAQDALFSQSPNAIPITALSSTGGSGGAGSIELTGLNVLLSWGYLTTTVEALTSGASSGSITVDAANSVHISNSYIEADTFGARNAGMISIKAPSVLIDTTETDSNCAVAGACTLISTEALGRIGFNSSPTAPFVLGDAGDISITATGPSTPNNPSLLVNTGSAITTTAGISIFDSEGDLIASNAPNALVGRRASGGTITMSAPNGMLQIEGTLSPLAPGSAEPDGLSMQSNTLISAGAGASAGQAGGVAISGAQVQVDGAEIRNVARTTAVTAPSQASLSITSTGGTVALTDALITSSTEGGIDGGPISIEGSTVNILGTSTEIASTTSGSGKAGVIGVTGSSISILGGLLTTSTTGSGDAGDIRIMASGADTAGSPSLQIDRVNVQSTASGMTGQGPGAVGSAGQITITATNGSVSLGDLTADATPTKIQSSADQYSGQAGTVTIGSAGTLTAQDTTIDTSVATSQLSDGHGIAYAPGTISLTSPRAVTLTDSTLNATTAGNVAAGDIQATAGGPLDITSVIGAARSAVTTSSTSTASTAGRAGKITLAGPTLTIDASDILATIYGGNAETPSADIALNTSGAFLMTDGATLKANTLGGASGGTIDLGSVLAPIASLAVNSGSMITVDASGTGATAGRGGSLVVTSTGPVTLSGSGTALSSNSSNQAAGGSIDISASSLSMDSGAQVTANTSSSGITSSAGGSGLDPALIKVASSTLPNVSGGNVLVNTSGNVVLAGDATTISANATVSGSGGTVTVKSAGLSLIDGASIATTATGTGNSGDISIVLTPIVAATGGTLPPLLLTGGSLINTNAAQSTGGDITINAGGSPLKLTNSAIEATAGATGNGGNIKISEVGQTTLQGSAILAQADSGDGGAIYLFLGQGALFVEDSQSLVSAQSTAGNDGTVTINSPQTNFNSALATPDVSVTKTPELERNACRRDRNRSTFVREGRGGVAPSPDGYQTTVPTAPAAAAPATPTAKSTSTLRMLLAAAPDAGCN